MRRVWEIALATHRRFGADAGGFMAGAITYHAFLSMFPLLLLGVSILGFVLAGNADLQTRAVQTISESVPGIGNIVAQNLSVVTETRSAAGVAGILGLLWTGIGVAETSSFALARVWRVEPERSTWKNKLRAIATVGVLGVIGLAGVGAAVAVSAIEVAGWAAVGLRAGGTMLAFAIDLGLFVAAYRLLGPPGRGIIAPWRGAAFAAAGWTALKLLGGWYASRTVADSSAVYGTFASTVGVLVILFLAARIFLYGAELNAIWVERYGGGLTMRDAKSEMDENGKRSTPQLMRSIASDSATLVRKEVELARQEVVEAIVARAKAAAALIAAGIAALIGVIFLGAAGAHALENVMEPWAARLVVGGGFIVLALAAAGIGVMRAKRPPLKPEMTVETVKEDVEWAKAQLKR